MRDKETLEDIIKSKLSEKEFSFEEENWEDAENRIAAYRKKEQIKKTTTIFLSGLVLGIILMFPFINKTNNSDSKLVTQNSEQVLHSTTTIEKKRTVSNNVKSILTKKMMNKEKANRTFKNNSYLTLSISKYEQSNNSTPSSTGRYFHNKNTIHSKQNQSTFESKLADKTTVSSDDIIESLVSDKEKTNLNRNVGNEILNFKDDLLSTDSAISMSVLPIDSILKDAVAMIKKDSSKKYFLAIAKPNSDLDKSWQLSVSVGGNYLKGGTLNPIQGFELKKTITKNWMMGTGVYYTYLNINASNAVKTIVTNTTYDFGYTSDVVQIKTNDLHYIAVPVFMQYNINKKNSIVFGATNYMLFTVSNNYSTYKESYGNKQNISSTKTFGYSAGFNPYDIGLLLGYKRKLFNNISIGLYMNYGLMNLKRKGYYTENSFNKNISGQVMLTYRLH
jgi:hypothetical protein